MNIHVNGIEEKLIPPLTLSDYLLKKEIPSNTIVIEFNGEIIREKTYSSVNLKDNDTLEILRIVGGG